MPKFTIGIYEIVITRWDTEADSLVEAIANVKNEKYCIQHGDPNYVEIDETRGMNLDELSDEQLKEFIDAGLIQDDFVPTIADFEVEE